MAEVNPSNYIIGIAVFTLFIMSGLTLVIEPGYISGNTSYIDQGKLKDFNESFNQYSQLNEKVDTIKTNIESSDSDFGIFGVLNALINSAWQTLKTLISSFDFMDDAFKGLTAIFGIPTYVSAILTTLITIMIAFAIYRAIFKAEA